MSTTSPGSAAVPTPPPTFWAGPAMLVNEEPADGAPAETVPLLVLWSQNPQDTGHSQRAGETNPPGLPELLERGFARVSEPEVAAIRALPRLDDAEVRLSADRARFQLIDGRDPLVIGELSEASAQWRDTVGEADLLAVLIATERQPNPPPENDTDRTAATPDWLATAGTAGTLVGARLAVRVTDPRPA